MVAQRRRGRVYGESRNFPHAVHVCKRREDPMRKTCVCIAVVLLSAVGWAQSGNRPEILVLGTYHMANPGRDVYNMQADDVRSPKRQAEIGELLAVLKKFHPTKI